MSQRKNTDTNRHHHPAGVFLRGMAMGAADIVPGVSGGTIAFITGIYFRLLNAISALPGAFIEHLIRGRVAVFWSAVDGTFLVSLLAGIVTSVASLATLITWLLANHPILIWSFFFGLIIASVWHVGQQVQRYRWSLLAPFLAGTVCAWWVTTLPASELDPTGLIFFGSGALAICAMILPGISGSFLLLVVGMYAPVLAAVQGLDLGILGLFLAGCAVGLLSIAKLITLAFRHFHDTVLALLTGFMIGALSKVWPWQETLTWRSNSSGDRMPLNQTPVLPQEWSALTGQDPLVLQALLMALTGLGLVLVLDWVGQRRSSGDDANG